MPQSERREALPDHPVPAGMAAPEAWRLCVDGLVVQPLALSLSDIDALGAQTHTADVVCEEGWRVPEQQGTGVAVAALLGRAGMLPEGRFLKVYTGDFTVLQPLEEALTGRALLGTPSQRHAAHASPWRPAAAGGAWVDVLRECEVGGSAGSPGGGVPHDRGNHRPHPGAALSWPHPSPLCGVVQEGHEQGALRSSWWIRKERTDDERDHGADSR